MPTNDFLPFATAGGANVLSQSDWNALAARLSGYVAGVAQSQQVNKGLRQSAAMAAMIGQFINDYGGLDALDDGNIGNLETNLARTLQQGKFLLGVATGTANAWVLTPVPSVAAYALGRPMLVTIPATNTSTTVNANVSALGNRRVKKSDGTDPAVGDLVSGQMIWCADDGTSLRVLSTLPSDIAAQIAVNKSSFNIQQTSFAARAALSGTGFVTYQTGSYTKKSATSSLIVSISTNSYATGNAPGILRCAFGANSVQAVISSNDGSQSRPAANARKVFTGISAGALSWTLALGRNDGVSWSNVTNPNNADVGFLPTETTTSVTFEEVEP